MSLVLVICVSQSSLTDSFVATLVVQVFFALTYSLYIVATDFRSQWIYISHREHCWVWRYWHRFVTIALLTVARLTCAWSKHCLALRGWHILDQSVAIRKYNKSDKWSQDLSKCENRAARSSKVSPRWPKGNQKGTEGRQKGTNRKPTRAQEGCRNEENLFQDQA